MNFSGLYSKFTPSTKENFPVDVCTIQNPREQDVMDSDVEFICMIFDKRFKNDYRITIMKPYICKEDNGNMTFGWIDDFKHPHSNLENSCRLEDECVVGFVEFNNNRIDDVLWNFFINKLNSQWE